MKVTKYPQSCLLLEKDGKRIVIDPGIFFTQEFSKNDLGQVEAVLYTHQHGDHYDKELAKQFAADGVKLYGNTDVVGVIGEAGTAVYSGKKITIAGFEVMPHDIPHCLLPDGSEGPPNTGFIIDGNFFHPGDGIDTMGFTVDAVALPIIGPDISFLDGINLAKKLRVKRVIPIHYTSFQLDPNSFASYMQRGGLQADVIILKNGESVDL